MATRVGINGFGRMGKLGLRAGWDFEELEIVHINEIKGDAVCQAHLLEFDSVHGRWRHEITSREDAIVVDGRAIGFSAKAKPEEVDWRARGIDLMIECSGKFKTQEALQPYFGQGIKKVLVSAPVPEPALNIVYGINDQQYDPGVHHLVTAASCTTNCLAPVAKVLLENFGIRSGLMTTIHSYTGGQRLLDFPHKDLRRARAAALSMIPTTTGAARAVALVLPDLAGRLNGLAIRVPTPNTSIVDFVATVERSGLTVSDVNDALKKASEESLRGILAYSDLPLVSSDFNGSQFSSIADAPTTYVVDNMVKVLAWYDNEMGFSHRMLDLAVFMGSR